MKITIEVTVSVDEDRNSEAKASADLCAIADARNLDELAAAWKRFQRSEFVARTAESRMQ